MTVCSKWTIEQCTDKHHVSGNVRYLCCVAKTSEGAIRKLIPTVSGLHALQVSEYDADRSFVNKIFDHGTNSTK